MHRYCVVYGKACGSAPRAQRISVRILVGVHEGFGILQVGNAVTTIRNNRGMLPSLL
jgi:hypothetical protein